MKPCIAIISIGLALPMVVSSAAIVSVDVGQSAFGGSKSVDFDGDGSSELLFRGNGGVCTDDVPTSTCVYSVSISATPDFEFLLQGDGSSLPKPLVEGDVLGDGSFIGGWASTPFNSIHVSAVDHLLDPDRSGYPDYLDGFDVFSIGFRQRVDNGQFRYGWVDVRLTTYIFDIDGEAIIGGISWPTVLASHYSDTIDEPVAFVPVPEPSSTLMILIGTAIAQKRTRRIG
jgi:hypothetical protein